MEYLKIPGMDIMLSRVALGTWAIGGWMWGGTDEKESIQTIHAALDKGINLIDTAPVYGFGKSEEIVGKALKEYPERDKVRISTKVALDWTEEGQVFRNATRRRIMKEVEDSLQRLGVDTIDIYHVHWPDPHAPETESAKALCELKRQGKIRTVGVSNHNPAQMKEFSSECPINFCQPPYNMFEREIENDVMPYCNENNIILMTYGALCRGMLSGKMTRDRVFPGDDLRNMDPKFQQPRFDEYLEAVERLKDIAKQQCGMDILPFAVRWVLEKTAGIALWGGRKPEQMNPVDEVAEHRIDTRTLDEVDQVLEQAINDPVGPEFMAPPDRMQVNNAA